MSDDRLLGNHLENTYTLQSITEASNDNYSGLRLNCRESQFYLLCNTEKNCDEMRAGCVK